MSDYHVLQYLTSTVGLIVSKDVDDRLNIMSAEWTYFVARDPLHIGIGVQTSNFSHDIIERTSRFSVTFCDVDLAPVADMCGSFSGREFDKLTSDLITLDGPHVGTVPFVKGGVLNAECEVRQTVSLPGYSLFIGEAIWWNADDKKAMRPLVKHGSMYTLGSMLDGNQVCASATHNGGSISIAATAHGAPTGESWRVSIWDENNNLAIEEQVSVEGDLMHDVILPSQLQASPTRVTVELPGYSPGNATIPPKVSTH